MARSSFSGPVYSANGFIGPTNQVALSSLPTPATITTAGAAAYTAAQLLTGLILRDPNGSNRTDTLPTAATLVAALGSAAAVGMSFRVTICNTADAAETITLSPDTSGAAGNTAVTQAIAQNGSKTLIIRLTNVTSGAEAYVIYA